jgi:hypothetical protein
MRGVKSDDLVSIIDFLYYGEANIYQDNLDVFLALADELKLKGLSGNTKGQQTNENVERPPSQHKANQEASQTTSEKVEKIPARTGPQNYEHMLSGWEPTSVQNKVVETFNEEMNLEDKVFQEISLVVVNEFSGDMKELDEQIKSLMVVGERVLPNGQGRAYVCQVCGKEANGRNMRDHIEAKHVNGVSLPCNLCGKTFRTRHCLRTHKSAQHKVSTSNIL